MYRGDNWEIARKVVLSRDDWQCQRCHTPADNVHHIIPYEKSRDNRPTNLITLCNSCHTSEDNFYRQFKIPSMGVRKIMLDKYGEDDG